MNDRKGAKIFSSRVQLTKAFYEVRNSNMKFGHTYAERDRKKGH